MRIAALISTTHCKVLLRTLAGVIFVSCPLLLSAQAVTARPHFSATYGLSAPLPEAPQPNHAALVANALAPPGFSPPDDASFTSSSYDFQNGSLATHSQDPQQVPSTSAPSLDDLGLTAKPDPDLQARLDRRSHMLKVHQELGLYTTLPILAACISGAGATPDKNSYGNTTSRDVHVGLGGLAIGMYASTAYYAIRAPRIPESGPARGGIKLHKYLIWIHAPGMILTPILGTMAFNQINSGQRPSGIAQYHQAVAVTTAIAYGASILAVSWPLHLPHMGSK